MQHSVGREFGHGDRQVAGQRLIGRLKQASRVVPRRAHRVKIRGEAARVRDDPVAGLDALGQVPAHAACQLTVGQVKLDRMVRLTPGASAISARHNLTPRHETTP